MPRANPWLLYAMGGGLGHLTRALALARAAHQRGQACRILTNSSFAPAVFSQSNPLLAGMDVLTLSPTAGKDALRECVRTQLAAGVAAFIVDTFPRGIGGELADLLPQIRVPRVWVHRDLNPEYVRQFALADVADSFARILVPGESAPLCDHPNAVLTQPWVICDHAELLDRNAARDALNAPGDARPLVAVVGSGNESEAREMALLAAQLSEKMPDAIVRFASLAASAGGGLDCRLYPLLRAHAGIDLLIGSGGYNMVHEARLTQTPLLAFAQQRLYDRQAVRLRPHESVSSVAECIARAQTLLIGASPRRSIPAYVNGAEEGAEVILALVQE
jgi:UDP:flavonoid glycosyltransferase YjiC (YdhE family)